MGRLSTIAIRSLLPGFALALGLPVAIRLILPPEEVGDFDLAALGLGCAVLAAKAYGPGTSRLPEAKPQAPDGSTDVRRTMPWPIVTGLSLVAAVAFVCLHPAPSGHAGLPIPLLAVLTLVPALGIVPYLTLRTGKPFAAVVLAAFIVALTKLAACAIVRMVHGPDALANGYMSGDWQSAPLMISLFWIGTVTISLALGLAARRPGTFGFVRPAST